VIPAKKKVEKADEVKPEVASARPVEDRVMDRVRERFDTLRVRTPARPTDSKGEPLNPRLPNDLTTLNDEELGRVFSEFACMCVYVKMHLAVRAVEHAEAKRRDKITRAQVRLTKEGTVEDKAAQVEVDSKTRSSSYELLVVEGTEVMTSALMESFLIGRDAASREMSRRQAAFRERVG
jgi:hypothetical protein